MTFPDVVHFVTLARQILELVPRATGSLEFDLLISDETMRKDFADALLALRRFEVKAAQVYAYLGESR